MGGAPVASRRSPLKDAMSLLEPLLPCHHEVEIYKACND